MQPSVEIRRATVADAAEIARLAGELGYPTTPEVMTRGLTALLANDHHHVAVAAGDERLLGWMHVEHRVSLGGDRAELRGLVVDSAARRHGLGRRLVAVAEQWARAQGLASLTVRSNVVREQSHPFYESLGYARRKTQHVYGKKLASEGSR
jgi:GNAT superfamily N-acetyltransferase